MGYDLTWDGSAFSLSLNGTLGQLFIALLFQQRGSISNLFAVLFASLGLRERKPSVSLMHLRFINIGILDELQLFCHDDSQE